MQVSAKGRTLLLAREAVKLVAYRDSVGVLTIGAGHTGRMSPPAVVVGMRITMAQADAFLASDLLPIEAALNAMGVDLNQDQFDALASFVFNVGLGRTKPTPKGFAGSSVRKHIMARDFEAVPAAILLWDIPASIIARREAEAMQFAGTAFLARSNEPAPKLPPVATVPAATVPAQPPAASKEPNMADTSPLAKLHPNAAAAVPGVDLFQGVVNIGEHLAEMLGAGANAIQSVKLPDVTGAPGSHNFFGTLGNVQKAASKVGEIVADAKKGDVREGVADGADLLKLIFATLDIYKIDVPVLSTVIASLPSLHAGADKPA